MQTRDDEIEELDSLMRDRSVCRVPVRGGMEALNGKVNILMQAYLSRAMIKTFSLASDMMFIKQVLVFVLLVLHASELLYQLNFFRRMCHASVEVYSSMLLKEVGPL